MGRIQIVSPQEIVPELDTTGMIPLEQIAQGFVEDVAFGRRSEYGLADDAPRIDNTISSRAGTVERLNGQVLVDLGAGTRATGLYIALQAGARGYIGVEPHFPKSLYHGIASVAAQPASGDILASATSDDMLMFLKRLPPDSVSLLMTGIDGHIISDACYARQVAPELVRVLHPEGAYVCDIDHIEPGSGVQNIGESVWGMNHRNMGVYVKGAER